MSCPPEDSIFFRPMSRRAALLSSLCAVALHPAVADTDAADTDVLTPPELRAMLTLQGYGNGSTSAS
jgi:hypothetical protein